MQTSNISITGNKNADPEILEKLWNTSPKIMIGNKKIRIDFITRLTVNKNDKTLSGIYGPNMKAAQTTKKSWNGILLNKRNMNATPNLIKGA